MTKNMMPYAVLDDLIGLCETERTDASICHDAIIYASKRILRNDIQERSTNKMSVGKMKGEESYEEDMFRA